MKVALYAHGGSGNHGCEALVRTVASLMPIGTEISVFSKDVKEDVYYIKDSNLKFVSCGNMPSKKTISGFWAAVRMKFFKRKFAYVKPAYKSLLKYADKNTLAVSIGGDNYCYDGYPEVLRVLNKALSKKGAKTVLFGCSIEPALLTDEKIVEDLSRYTLITARESITANALKNAGVKTKIALIPDSAFILPCVKKELPQGFIENNTVGINISPLVLSCEGEKNVLFDAYCQLIEYIIAKTQMQIALIPHVVWKSNNDNTPISLLFEKYKETERVVCIKDCNATELKGYISRCRFFVGARTHATIAAYSSCIPTLVVGYSVKSKGIARDIFGTEENYVCSVQDINKKEDLIQAFQWIFENEKSIREHLKKFIPTYIEKVYYVQEKLQEIIE